MVYNKYLYNLSGAQVNSCNKQKSITHFSDSFTSFYRNKPTAQKTGKNCKGWNIINACVHDHFPKINKLGI